ncbi:MAG: hypothetical protein H6713_24885 [Myxococcales bacterium]|nr:hypothetical protein [Myxococcales bacterium]MCB9753204.1 hypothetical protein [Myxococcales bacterium]
MARTKLILPLLAAFSLSLAACDSEEKPEPKKTETAEPKVEKKDIATLIVGDAPTVPEVYKGLKLGMSGEEAKKLVPAMPEEDTIKDEAYGTMRFYSSFDDDTGLLQRMRFQLPKDKALELIKSKWGEPKEGEELGKPVQWWFNPAEGVRASLKEGFGDELDVELTAYIPAAQFLGEGKALAFLEPGALLGSSADDVRKNYAKQLREKSKEDAEKDRARLEKFSGKDLGVLGEPKPSMHLEFLPTEWGSYWTRVHLDFNDENKVSRVWFGLEFEPHPAAKDELLALLKAKWGEPEEQEKYGRTRLLFQDELFSIEVEDDTITKKWDVFLEPKAG